jgi:hypothetical protein
MPDRPPDCHVIFLRINLQFPINPEIKGHRELMHGILIIPH